MSTLPEGCMWAVTKGGRSICQPPRREEADAEELSRLRRIAWLIGSIFVHGNFVAETANERELQELLTANGTFWNSLSDFDAEHAGKGDLHDYSNHNNTPAA